MGIDTSHDGLSQKKRRFRAAFRRKVAKNAPKGPRSRPF
jgi:hypothetical protein